MVRKAHHTFNLGLSRLYSRATHGFSEPQNFQLYLFTILDTWHDDSPLKTTLSRKLLQLSNPSQDVHSKFLPVSSACTICILHVCMQLRTTMEIAWGDARGIYKISLPGALKCLMNPVECVNVYGRPTSVLLMQDIACILKLLLAVLNGMSSIVQTVTSLHFTHGLQPPVQHNDAFLLFQVTLTTNCSLLSLVFCPTFSF